MALLPGFAEGDLDTLKRLERLPFSKPHLRLLFMGGLGYTFDGMDAALIAFILAPAMKLWSLSTGQTGVLGSSLMIGYLVGAFTAGTLGDLIGRRKVMMYALFVYTFATLFAACSMNWQFLFWSRVVAGFGVGAESAIIAPFLSEFVQSKYRGRFIGSLSGFFSFGFVFAALLGYFIVPAFAQGWRIAQVITFLPIVMLLWWRRSLPESPRWLIQQGRSLEAEQVVANLEAFYVERGQTLPDHADVPIPAMGLRKAGNFFQNLAALWHKDMARSTFMLWTLWITITFCVLRLLHLDSHPAGQAGDDHHQELRLQPHHLPGPDPRLCYSVGLPQRSTWTASGPSCCIMVLGGVAAFFLSGARHDAGHHPSAASGCRSS
jgi:putative MFS transporter